MKTNRIIVTITTLLFLSSFSFTQENKIIVKLDEGKDTISRHIYGHFAEHLGRCIYGGFWVGPESSIPNTRGIRNDVVEAFKEIEIPNLRWPGGCFADTYHWRDGIGDPSERGNSINMSWGGIVEDNSFGTHEFMDLCKQINCEPVICGNMGSGTVQEMAEWVEYLTSDFETPLTDLRKKNGREEPWKVKFWGIGNEMWGCGGMMTPETYSQELRRYSRFLNNYSGNKLYRIASGPNSNDYAWTEYLLKEWSTTDGWLKGYMNGISLHYYTICHDWSNKGSAINFNENDWFSSISKTLKIDEYISDHIAIIEKYDPENKIGLVVDEWGDWFDTEPGTNPAFLYQQNTLRDAIVASLNLDIFNKHCSRISMANIAQAINVLQSVVLTKDDKLVKTPTFYVFKMYKVHHDAVLLPTEIDCMNYAFNDQEIPQISATASKKEGKVHITITNVNPNEEAKINIVLDGNENYHVISSEIITADTMNAYNDFGQEERVNMQTFDNYKQKKENIAVTMPSKSIILLTLETK